MISVTSHGYKKTKQIIRTYETKENILVQVVQRHVASFQNCCTVPPPPLFAAATALAAPQAPKSETQPIHGIQNEIPNGISWMIKISDDKILTWMKLVMKSKFLKLKPHVLICIIRWRYEGPYHLTRSAEASKSQRKSKYLSDWREEGDTSAKLQFFENCLSLSEH